MKKRILTIVGIVVLLATLVAPMAVWAAEGDTVITANFESISITAPTGETDLVLTATGSNSLISTTGSVTSNVAYDVSVKDKMESSKDAGDAGQMVKWDGSWENGTKIADVVTVGSTHASQVGPIDVTASDQDIISNATAATNDDLLLTVAVTTSSESALSGTARYKITLTFTAAAHT